MNATSTSHPAMQLNLGRLCMQGRPVLQDIALNVAKGGWTAVVGPNGAGKSTLMRVLAGIQPMDGQVMLLGRFLSEWPAKSRAQTMAWLGQAEAGADDLSAWDVVMLGRMPHQAWLANPSLQDQQAVQEAMTLTQSWDWRFRPMGQLSGGERQRVLLARALAVQAQVLLMDEPLAHLDPPHQADWLDMVHTLRSRGVTVVSVLHELNMALQADDLIVMRQGRVHHHGAAHDPQSHRALVEVFDQRIALHAVGSQWVAIPCAAPQPSDPGRRAG